MRSTLQELSDHWAATHESYDGDDRTPLEVLDAGLIDWDDFWNLVAPGALASQRLFESITSPEHKVDLTLPAVKSPSAAERATWRTS